MREIKKHFANKSVLLFGASGGLGEAYARAFSQEGARLLLVGRNVSKLTALACRLEGDISIYEADITSQEALSGLSLFVEAWAGKLDVIVNATGYDVRKALEDHSEEDIRKCLETNLMGAIFVTKVFVPLMRNSKGSVIVHTGGFADGRLAFPYYSADVASRAGVFSFVEAMNRELYQEGRAARLIYFCPNAAHTPAEEPYHGVWREMGVSISSVEEVSAELIKTVSRIQTVSIMGGATRFFAKLNGLFPKLADVLLMKKYGVILKKHFGISSGSPPETQKRSCWKTLGIFMVAFSFLLYALLPLVPFLPMAVQTKAVIAGGMMALSEVVFWIGGMLLGKEIIKKIRQCLNPLKWLCCGSSRAAK